MKVFTCRVAELQAGLLQQSRATEFLPSFLSDTFTHGSSLVTGSADFDIQTQFTALSQTSVVPGPAVSIFDLQRALEGLVGIGRDSELGVNRIGLLFARSMESRPTMLGLMFDDRIVGEESEKPAYAQTPRQGCAVFVDAIANYRLTGSEEFFQEIAFIAAHELGHVFNLWHMNQPPSFMAESLETGVRPDEYFRFFGEAESPHTQNQRRFLSQCSVARSVHPGGSAFGMRQPEGPDGVDISPVSVLGGGSAPLTLRIDVVEPEFWSFEPVELDLTVSVSSGRRSVRVLDAFDPGYSHLKIWIQDEQGARRTYRAPARYCFNPARRTISPDAPFRRDITLFRQAGGLTFPAPGEYKVWIELQVSKRRSICSNKVTLHVRAPHRRSKQYRELRHLLIQPSSATVLFYRHSRISSREVGNLTRAGSLYGPRGHRRGLVEFAIGRSLLRRAERVKDKYSATRLRKAATTHMACSLDLLAHSRRKEQAKACLEFLT